MSEAYFLTLPDGSVSMYPVETQLFYQGSKWASEQIAKDLRRKADQLVLQGYEAQALGMYAAAVVVEQNQW